MHIGGHVELDENPWQGLIRELREESGYDLSQLQLLQPAGVVPLNFSDAVAHPTPVALLTVAYQGEHSHYHTDICYAFLTEEEPAHAPADDESGDFRLLSRDEIADLREGEIPANIREIALTVLDDYSKTWQKVIPPAI